MNKEIKEKLVSQGVEIIGFVDVSMILKNEIVDYPRAIIFAIPLPREFIVSKYKDIPIERDEYLEREHKIEDLADLLEQYIIDQGYRARSLSEKKNSINGCATDGFYYEGVKCGISILPIKTIASYAGMGVIGKNNLLMTNDYGSAIVLAAVLTDAPVKTDNYTVLMSKCGSCNVCATICPTNALHNHAWTIEGCRDDILDVSKCCWCLKCMTHCPITLRYAIKG